MARHRKGLRRLLDPKPRAHALFSLLTRGRPSVARALDFFPDIAPPNELIILHDDSIQNPIVAAEYDEWLRFTQVNNKETLYEGEEIPPFPGLRRVIWQAKDVYIPGKIICPVDIKNGHIISFHRKHPSNWSMTRPRLFRKSPKVIYGNVIAIPKMKHYGHLLTDLLAPIAFAVHRGLISRKKPVSIVCARSDNPVTGAFADGMLNLGYATEIWRLGEEDSALCEAYTHCEVLCSSGEHRFAMPEAVPVLRELFANASGYCQDFGALNRKVFLTRGGAKLRRVQGEAELIDGLVKRGFRIFEARWTNHPEQLAVFSSFDILIGVHGAGLANAIFGKRGARLVEIQAADARKTTGLHWAASVGLNYTCLLGGPEGDRQGFAIDVDDILAAIDAVAN